MAFELVNVRARTRGKSPKEFTYDGIGKKTARKVQDKDGNPIVMNAKDEQVSYTIEKNDKGEEKITSADGITLNDKGELVLPSGFRYVEVDDLDVTGLATPETFPEVLALLGGDIVKVQEYALTGYNVAARDAASPVVEVVKEDELTPIVAAMVDNKILTDKDATTWRRMVTSGAAGLELDRIDFARQTKQYKALVKTGWKPETVAA